LICKRGDSYTYCTNILRKDMVSKSISSLGFLTHHNSRRA